MARMNRLLVVALSVALLTPAAAQQPATPAQGAPTFRATTRLIVQTVTVKDKDGNFIEGLTPK